MKYGRLKTRLKIPSARTSNFSSGKNWTNGLLTTEDHVLQTDQWEIASSLELKHMYIANSLYLWLEAGKVTMAVFGVVALLFVTVVSSSDVIELTDSNFESRISGMDLALVEFFAPW